jgi:hypothetical protein
MTFDSTQTTQSVIGRQLTHSPAIPVWIMAKVNALYGTDIIPVSNSQVLKFDELGVTMTKNTFLAATLSEGHLVEKFDLVPNLDVDTFTIGGEDGFDNVVGVLLPWSIQDGSLWVASNVLHEFRQIGVAGLREDPHLIKDWKYSGRRELEIRHVDDRGKRLNSRRECVYYWTFHCKHWNIKLGCPKNGSGTKEEQEREYEVLGNLHWMRAEHYFNHADGIGRVHVSHLYDLVDALGKGCVALPVVKSGRAPTKIWPSEPVHAWRRKP